MHVKFSLYARPITVYSSSSSSSSSGGGDGRQRRNRSITAVQRLNTSKVEGSTKSTVTNIAIITTPYSGSKGAVSIYERDRPLATKAKALLLVIIAVHGQQLRLHRYISRMRGWNKFRFESKKSQANRTWVAITDEHILLWTSGDQLIPWCHVNAYPTYKKYELCVSAEKTVVPPGRQNGLCLFITVIVIWCEHC